MIWDAQFLHSDQGRNFESSLLRSTPEAFGLKKTRTTAYHPQGDGMVERATDPSYRCFARL